MAGYLVATRIWLQREGIVGAGQIGRFGHRQAAQADLQVERRIDLGIIEFHQDVIAGDADMGGPEGDEGRHVESPDPDDVDMRVIGGKTQRAGLRIVEIGFRQNAGRPDQRHRLVENTPFGQGQHQFLRIAHVIVQL